MTLKTLKDLFITAKEKSGYYDFHGNDWDQFAGRKTKEQVAKENQDAFFSEWIIKELREEIIKWIIEINKQIKEKPSKVFFNDKQQRIFWDFSEYSLVAKKSILFEFFNITEEDIK